jgi:hypothetical protein
MISLARANAYAAWLNRHQRASAQVVGKSLSIVTITRSSASARARICTPKAAACSEAGILILILAHAPARAGASHVLGSFQNFSPSQTPVIAALGVTTITRARAGAPHRPFIGGPCGMPSAQHQSTSQSQPRTPSRSAGFSQLPNHLIDRGVIHALRPLSLRVLLLMLRRADDDGRCWPSQRAMANRCGASVRWVRAALEQLANLGLLRLVSRGRSGQASLYQLTLDAAASGPAAKPHASQGPGTRPAGAPRAPDHGGSPRRGKRKCASQIRARTVPTTHTHDSNPTLTPPRAANGGGDAGDVCADAQAQQATATAPSATATSTATATTAGSRSRSQRLLAIGISESNALKLLATHAPQRIDCALDNAEFLASNARLKNAAGYVVEALRNNYGPLPERIEAQRAQAKRRRSREAASEASADQQRRVRDEQHQAQRDAAEALAFVKAMSDADRAAAVRDTLETLPASARAALSRRDARESPHLAMLVRDHVQSREAASAEAPAAIALEQPEACAA